MFCYNCGEKISDDAAFCYKCGASIKGDKAAGSSGNMGGNSSQKFNPLVNGIDEDFVKSILVKIAFLAVSIIVFYIMNNNLFSINYLQLQGFFEEAGISNTVDFIEEEIDYARNMSDEEKELYTKALHAAKWCILIGAFGYIVAAIVSFLGMEALSHLLTLLGCILHVFFTVLFIVVVKTVYESSEYYVKMSDSAWLYILLNAVLIVLSFVFFWGSSYEIQTNSLIEKSEAYDRKIDVASIPSSITWRCEECGKINQGYCGTCSCGNTKK